FDSTYRFKQN
ncbi:Glucitol operon repressor, partial [Haemophilus influenzae]